MHSYRQHGFALGDLVAGVCVVAVFGALALAMLSDTRRNARLGEDFASLNRFAVGTSHYAADNNDALWSFSWKDGETFLMMDMDGNLVPTEIPEGVLNGPTYQAVHLIRSLGGRIGENGMPIPLGWLPNVRYASLPLLDYLGEDLLARWTTSAADQVRQHWKDDPIKKFDQGAWLPLQPDPSPYNRRVPYSLGFEVGVAAWDPNQSELGDEFIGTRFQQGGTHNWYSFPLEAEFGGTTLADVAHPCAKAHMYDTHQRHFGQHIHFFGVEEGADDERLPARVPVLTYDGATSIRAAAESNPGWRPNTLHWPCTTFLYQPDAWEPATTGGNQISQFSYGVFRWTRGGLKGIDFGARPMDTGQADPGECDL